MNKSKGRRLSVYGFPRLRDAPDDCFGVVVLVERDGEVLLFEFPGVIVFDPPAAEAEVEVAEAAEGVVWQTSIS